MKTVNLTIATAILVLFTVLKIHAQQSSNRTMKSIEPYALGISNAKTTNIVFPFAIVSVDRGSKDILAQKVNGAGNILQVKAARENFVETNLTVVTADGKLNSFILSYSRQPAILNLSLAGNHPRTGPIDFTPERVNQAQVQAYAKAALGVKKQISDIKDENSKMWFELTGIFIKENIMYYRINIVNWSNIKYDIDQLRFFIRDQKKASRSASQEIEIEPVYIENNTVKVEGRMAYTLVVALPKVTIPDKKYLAVQLMEKNGGRHMEVHVKSRHILAAALLPDQYR